MPRALILGGTGAVGRATAGRLLDAAWEVDVTGRDPARFPAELADAGARFIASDRRDPTQLHEAFGNGADLLVDCVCFTADDAVRLLPFVGDAGSTVMISSKAVYVDDEGRHSNSDSAPMFAGPISEAQPTVAPRRHGLQLPRGLRRQQGRGRAGAARQWPSRHRAAAVEDPRRGRGTCPRMDVRQARARRPQGDIPRAISGRASIIPPRPPTSHR